MRFIHQGLSLSPLAGGLDEAGTRRYLALLARLDAASIPDPEGPETRFGYVPRAVVVASDVLVSPDEIQQIGEFVLAVQWVGWLRKHVMDAVDWARAAPDAA